MSASPEAPIPLAGVAGFDRNQWQLSIGISGNLRLESVAGFDRNQWQPSRGIRIIGLPVLIIALFAFRRLLFNQVSGDVTVAHLLTGRTIHCKSLDELYSKENEITQKIKDHCEYLEGMDSLGNEQRIDLKKG